jgi:hypothetical protein
MKLDTNVQLMGSVDLTKQGVEDIAILTNVTGRVIELDGDDVQVAFEFDSGQYHGVYVWVATQYLQECP